MFRIRFASELFPHQYGQRRRRPARYAPVLHTLEDRCLLSSFNEFPLPDPMSQPFGITTGPDGNVWFTENHASQIGRTSGNPEVAVECCQSDRERRLRASAVRAVAEEQPHE